MVWIKQRQLIEGHHKRGQFGTQIINKTVFDLPRKKCNENFMYSVGAASSVLQFDTLKKYLTNQKTHSTNK